MTTTTTSPCPHLAGILPVTDAWSRLQAALRSTVDATLLSDFTGNVTAISKPASTAVSPCTWCALTRTSAELGERLTMEVAVEVPGRYYNTKHQLSELKSLVRKLPDSSGCILLPQSLRSAVFPAELVGTRAWHESGLGAPDDVEHLKQRITTLEHKRSPHPT